MVGDNDEEWCGIWWLEDGLAMGEEPSSSSSVMGTVLVVKLPPEVLRGEDRERDCSCEGEDAANACCS